MKRFVETYNAIEGYHRWKDAPKECEYLASRHRHIFVIRCRYEVKHNDREIEINLQQTKIEKLLRGRFGHPCEFGNSSCEDIAELIIEQTNAQEVTVLEDNYGGATLSR